jgi:hypothetical protein
MFTGVSREKVNGLVGLTESRVGVREGAKYYQHEKTLFWLFAVFKD